MLGLLGTGGPRGRCHSSWHDGFQGQASPYPSELSLEWAALLALLSREMGPSRSRISTSSLGCAQFPSQILSSQNATLREELKEKPRSPLRKRCF